MATPNLSDACNDDLGQSWKDIKIDGQGSKIPSDTLANNRIYVARTVAGKTFEELCAVPIGKADPCGDDKMGGIWRALKKFFAVLKSVQKYYNKYVNGALNFIQNLQGEIRETISAISAGLRTFIQRIREWILNKIRRGIEDLLNSVLPPLMKQIKSGLLKQVIDQIFCKFEDIIAGLAKMVGEFLYSLVGQVINTPLCAAENFLNALLNKLANDLDKALEPIFKQINDILGGITKVAGSVFEAIDFVLGFEGFLCDKPDCPEIKEFTASLDGGLKNSALDNFANFDLSASVDRTITGWMDDFFGKPDGSYVSPGGCYSGTFQCGLPQISIFGGGGSGAVANAVVNEIGQIIGANLLFGGKGYTSTPFVTISDPGNCGRNASGYAEMDDDGNGRKKVKNLVITNPGIGYTNNTISNIIPPVIKSFTGSPDPVQINQVLTLSWNVENADYVSLLKIKGYNKKPLISQASIPINASNVLFAAGSKTTKQKYTIKATKNVPNSAPIEVFQDLEVEIIDSTANNQQQPSSQSNSNKPIIDKFIVNPIKLYQGQVYKFEWETTDANQVGLNIVGYNNVPVDGSASLVVPQNLNLSGVSTFFTYTLTATNTNASSGNNTTTSNVTIEVLPPTSNIATQLPTVPFPSIGTGTTIPIIIGTGTTLPINNPQNPNNIIGTSPTGIIGVPTTGILNNIYTPGFVPGGKPTTTVNGAPIPTISGPGTSAISGGQTPTSTIGTSTINGGQTPATLNDVNAPIAYKTTVSQIDDIKILNTGSGYSQDDEVEIVGGNNGAEFKLQLTPLGQIAGIQIINPGIGFLSIPIIRINSRAGVGAKFRSVLKFTPIDELVDQEQIDQEQIDAITSDKLIKVIDCVLR